MKLLDKKILAVTDGSDGMISQARGLANHISEKVEDYKTEIYFPWSKAQPGFLPIYKWIFKQKINFIDKPDIIISCGRKSVYLSLFLKKIYKNKIFTIHIQNPKINSKHFDCVVAPNHDGLYGTNVINSIGALHQFTKDKINNYNENFKTIEKENLVSVIIGGKNRHYKFSLEIAKNIIEKIKKLKKKFNNYNFLIIASRRTDKEVINLFQKQLGSFAFIWDKKSKNPYLYALKNSKFFILTSDSSSMISECAFTGKPIYIYHLPFKRNSLRFENFHSEFDKMNITRKFKDDLENWEYKILDEAKRIAGILRVRILNKQVK